MTITVELPTHLQRLAHVEGPVPLDLGGEATFAAAIDALEAKYPVLCGAIRDHVTKERRPFVRYFACQEDYSHHPPETPLPERVVSGAEPLLIVGAMAGG